MKKGGIHKMTENMCSTIWNLISASLPDASLVLAPLNPAQNGCSMNFKPIELAQNSVAPSVRRLPILKRLFVNT